MDEIEHIRAALERLHVAMNLHNATIHGEIYTPDYTKTIAEQIDQLANELEWFC